MNDHKYIERSKTSSGRFKLTSAFKRKLEKKLKDGEEFDLARKHAMITKSDNPKVSRRKNEKAKAAKAGAKGRKTLEKIKTKEKKLKSKAKAASKKTGAKGGRSKSKGRAAGKKAGAGKSRSKSVAKGKAGKSAGKGRSRSKTADKRKKSAAKTNRSKSQKKN